MEERKATASHVARHVGSQWSSEAPSSVLVYIYLGPSLSGRKISAPAYKPPMLVARRVQSLPALIVLRRAESSSSWSSSRATSVEICLSLGSFPPLRVLSIAASPLFTNDAVHFGLLLETRTAEYADSTTDCWVTPDDYDRTAVRAL